ncbi:unnamed protein product [Adineta ricciae]|uniref:Uncharacterized protein n=1 Tax=Adineta ricciae TaxID=249248 RepID=A0A816AMC2_ADIRI|nr:unnamed protein product [Adineta ricciae]CAF1599450.1 unnamed protein product [Adineta ricciae]
MQEMNGTCDQCLCTSQFTYSALNCFENHNTCQLFQTFPLSYHLEKTRNTRLYFPQQVFPNLSQCMSNLNSLLNQLKMANMTIINVPNPRDAIIDDHGYLVTIEQFTNQLTRFDPTTLNTISRLSLPNIPQGVEKDVVTYFNGSYYIGGNSDPITVIDSENLTVISNITTSSSGIRGLIFLQNGQTMIVASCATSSLIFLNRTSISPITYTYSFSQLTSFVCPHAVWRVNDTFFYVTSYYLKLLYSFTATNTNAQWNENFLFNVSNGNELGGAARVTIDNLNRFWFAYETDTIWIYDQVGTQLSNLTIPNSAIFDIRIMNNYLMYLIVAKTNQVIRLDPNIQC